MAITCKGISSSIVVLLSKRAWLCRYSVLSMRDITKASSICADFVQAVQAHDCKLLNKPKFHLLLHLPHSVQLRPGLPKFLTIFTCRFWSSSPVRKGTRELLFDIIV